ncbi:MAG: sulfatase-like hydrolase/transferase [Pirellula sp.]
MSFCTSVHWPSQLLLVVIAWAASLCQKVSLAQAQQSRPNILVIVADDLGYADVGVHRGCEVPTPNLDALAMSGVRCAVGYVTAPYCSPSRAGFLTGKMQTRFGHEFNPHQGEEAILGLPLEQRTIADVLRESGYATSAIGKWHQGFDAAHHPQSRGFDEYFGFLVGGHNYLLHRDAKPVFGSGHSHDLIYRGREVQHLDGYTTDLFTDEALGFMQKNTAKPWFLYLAYNAVHTPLEIAPRFVDRLPIDVTDASRRGYLSLLMGLDESVGRLTNELRAKHPNTLVFFFSDNGGSGRKPFFAYNTAVNTPLRGDKGQVWEGGIRVPFFVSWPNNLPAGKVLDQPVSTLDIFPTACAVAGAKAPDTLEGVNILPWLKGETAAAPHEYLYWRFGPQKAIRNGKWKLLDVRDMQAKTQSGWQLYDLENDMSEKQNLASSRPEIVSELTTAWNRWNQNNVEPRWIGSPNEDPRTPAVTAR